MTYHRKSTQRSGTKAAANQNLEKEFKIPYYIFCSPQNTIIFEVDKWDKVLDRKNIFSNLGFTWRQSSATSFMNIFHEHVNYLSQKIRRPIFKIPVSWIFSGTWLWSQHYCQFFMGFNNAFFKFTKKTVQQKEKIRRIMSVHPPAMWFICIIGKQVVNILKSQWVKEHTDDISVVLKNYK